MGTGKEGNTIMEDWERQQVKKYEYLFATDERYDLNNIFRDILAFTSSLTPDILGPGYQILDIGCGRGPFARPFNYVGIDFSEEAIKCAKAASPEADLRCMGISELPLNEEFDTIVCTDVMEHIPEKQVANILKKVQDQGAENIIFSICYKPTRQKDHEGNDPHITIKPSHEWVTLLENYFKVVRFENRANRNLFVYCERLQK